MTRKAFSLDLADAGRIIAAGELKAMEMGIPYNIAVADAGAGLVAECRELTAGRRNGGWVGCLPWLRSHGRPHRPG